MEPELASITLDMVTPTSSIVEIVYRAPIEFDGIELMGVDAGLSWMKDQSISLKMQDTDDNVANYICVIEIADSAEFRARGYDAEGDRWEAGLANHRIDRNEDGSIEFSTELDPDLYYFKGSLPTEYQPSIEDATFRIENAEEEDVQLFQILVDLSVWIETVQANPLSEDKIYPISGLIRHLKVKSREMDSTMVDEVVRPVLKALFNIYKSAMEFAKDDTRFLTGDWQAKGYIDLIDNLPEKTKELENNPDVGTGNDTGSRFKDLLKYVS